MEVQEPLTKPSLFPPGQRFLTIEIMSPSWMATRRRCRWKNCGDSIGTRAGRRRRNGRGNYRQTMKSCLSFRRESLQSASSGCHLRIRIFRTLAQYTSAVLLYVGLIFAVQHQHEAAELSWRTQRSAAGIHTGLSAVAAGRGRFVAAGNDFNPTNGQFNATVLTSADGTNWTARNYAPLHVTDM